MPLKQTNQLLIDCNLYLMSLTKTQTLFQLIPDVINTKSNSIKDIIILFHLQIPSGLMTSMDYLR